MLKTNCQTICISIIISNCLIVNANLKHYDAFCSHKRAAHTSAYDKNLDDQVHPTVVPDDVIQPQSEKYWAPHPQTGVFGPEAAGAGSGFNSSPATANGHNNSDSVLEEKAWFRPTSLEDLEKPHHQ